MFSGIVTKDDAWRRAWQFSALVSLFSAAIITLVAAAVWGPSLILPAAMIGLIAPSAVLPWMTFHAVDSRRQLNETLTTLEGLAQTDATTHLLNRNGFLQRGRTLFETLKVKGEPLSAVLIDVDHLEQINQTHGFDCGDAVLAHVADLLNLNIQSGVDLAARYGGAEFALLLPQADQAWASSFAERLRGTLANRALRHKEALIHISASFGVATLQPGDLGPEDVIRRAGQGLREAKLGGRNKVHAMQEAAGAALAA